MSNATQIDLEGETPVNPYSLLEAVNRSSDTAHMAWLLFLAIMGYLLIAVAGVNHRDLLLGTPVQLPVLNVEIDLVQFFQFAPVLLVLFHLGLVSQLVLLARKTLEFDNAVHKLEPSRRRTHPLRLELHNFFFVQGIAGPNRSVIMGLFLHAMSWMTLVVVPVVLLLIMQISFVPYHSIPTTWMHRVALLFDITILVLLGAFLVRAETNFFLAFARSIRHHPITTVFTGGLLVAILFISFVVATIPGERLDTLRRIFERPETGTAVSRADGWSSYIPDNPLPFLFGGADGVLFGVFHRNLIVTDADLVVDREVSKGEPSLSLRNRDLRFARLDRSDLHQADMTGVNLDGASLTGANLTDVKFNCDDENELVLTDDREKAKCASARKAKLAGARLNGASMNGIDLRNADLKEAHLVGASLKYAWLAGTNFSYANLQKADLTGGSKAQGAIFLIAHLEGADLTGAQLQYADFSSAFMQGVTLEHAHMQGANLRDTNLDSAYMRRARLHGADMTGANLRGADLRESEIWMTLPPRSSELKLADLRQIRLRSPTEREREALQQTIAAIADERLRQNVEGSLKGLLDAEKSAAWQGSNNSQIWDSLQTIERPGIIDNYRPELTTHLVRMACRAKWSNGAVAEGIARRSLNSKFEANFGTFYKMVTDKSCVGARKISKDARSAMAGVAEPEIESPISAPAPVPAQ